jgi:glycosyltransferase involved in cell wall biosynthesis
MQGKKGWDATMTRNDWFGRWAAREVERSGARTVFSYSYTARLPFRYAEGRDVLRVLGQIDPGPREQDVVKEYAADYLALAPPEDLIPSKYWNLWREEVDAADKIVVNSAWSARLLAEAGVPAQKMMEIPLVYEPVNLAVGSLQSSVFSVSACQDVSVSRSRLRALFLGSVILRKGVGQLFDAISLLKNEPVDFTFAGPIGVMIPDDVLRMPNVRFLGAVDKATAEALYRESDLFLFPTLSDGFGLTQLEALGHGLPVIASTHCGQVVEHGVTGLLLAEVTPDAVAETTMALVRDRDLLAMLKSGARMPDKFHPRHLAPALLRLVSGAV